MEADSAERVLSTRFLRLSQNDARELWPHLLPHIKRACAYAGGEMTPDAVIAGLQRGVYAVAVIADDRAIKAVAVIEVRDDVAGAALWIVLAGGSDAVSWRAHDDELKAWARELGCSVIRIRGRQGWVKMLPHWRWVLELDV